MTVSGMLIKDTVKVYKYLLMEVCMKDNIFRTRCMDRESIFTSMVKLTKESGKTISKMEVECGLIQKELAM